MFLQEDEERVCGNSSLCRTGSDCTAPSARAVPSALTGLCCGGGGREKLRERAARKYPVFIVSYHSHPLYQSPHIRSRIWRCGSAIRHQGGNAGKPITAARKEENWLVKSARDTAWLPDGGAVTSSEIGEDQNA